MAEGFRIYNSEGRLVNSVPRLTKTEYGGDRLLLHRRDIYDILKRVVASPSLGLSGGYVEIRTASRVVNCDEHQGTVTLENGNIIQENLIIGADGM